MDQNLDIHSSSLLEEGFKTLWKFIQLGNNLQIKKTCEENPTLINHRNQKGKTILIKIIENSRNISKNISTDKYEFIIKTLLNFGFDSNIPDNNGNTPLMLACQHVNINTPYTIKMLLKSGANIDLQNAKGETALIFLIKNLDFSNLDIKKLDIKSLDISKLDFANLDNKDLDVRNLCIKILGVKIFDVEILIEDINGILEHIVKILKEIISILSDNNVNIDLQDNIGYTAFRYACKFSRNFEEIVELLFKLGANVNSQDLKGYTPLMSASIRIDDTSSDGTALFLLRNGADPNKVTIKGKSALILTIEYDTTKIIKTLITYGADINLQDHKGRSPLMMACMHKREDIVELLLRENVDTNLANKKTQTALMYAIMYDINTMYIKTLIERCFNVDIQDNNGNTILNYVCKYIKDILEDIVESLLKKGANPNLVNNSKRSVLMQTLFNENKINIDKTVEILIQYSADINLQDNKGYSALMISVEGISDNTCTENIFNLLLTNGANIELLSTDNDNAESLASNFLTNNSQVYKTLRNMMIQKEVDLQLKDRIEKIKEDEISKMMEEFLHKYIFQIVYYTKYHIE